MNNFTPDNVETVPGHGTVSTPQIEEALHTIENFLGTSTRKISANLNSS